MGTTTIIVLRRLLVVAVVIVLRLVTTIVPHPVQADLVLVAGITVGDHALAEDRVLMAAPMADRVLAEDHVLAEALVAGLVLVAAAGREVRATKANVLNPAEMAAVATGALEEKSSLIQVYMFAA